YAGESNTKLIIAQQTIDNQSGSFAALLAANYRVLGDGITPCPIPSSESITCYGGWYLPSAFEKSGKCWITAQNPMLKSTPYTIMKDSAA
ncbi:hypothetical protein MXD98_16390, partial [Legionella pneumophila]|nr:hypothetical protein [Legionella pneumophila]